MVGRLVLAQEVRVQLLLPQLKYKIKDYHEVAAMRKTKGESSFVFFLCARQRAHKKAPPVSEVAELYI